MNTHTINNAERATLDAINAYEIRPMGDSDPTHGEVVRLWSADLPHYVTEHGDPVSLGLFADGWWGVFDADGGACISETLTGSLDLHERECAARNV